MIFATPLLLLLLLVPIALLVWEITGRRRRLATGGHPKILRAEAGSHRVELKTGTVAPRRGPRVWLFLGLCFAIVALARPQWGNLDEPVFDQSREILIAMDLSRSMLSTDVRPSRLERSKLLIQSLLDQLKGERVGLVIFSGTAFLQAPLSSDYTILREFLPQLQPEYLPEGGTNYRALIDASVEAFSTDADADRYLIILSDGEATEDNWRDRVEALKKKNIRVIGLGVGTDGGSMIPDGSGGFVKDERGAVVFSRLESATLRDLAKETNGLYQDASSWVDLADVIKTTVDRGQKGKFTEKVQVRHIERYQWPLALGAWCLLLSFFYEFPVRPKPRAVTLRGASSPPSPPPVIKTAALIALLCAPFFATRPARAQAAMPQPSTEPAPAAALSKMTGRLAVQDSQSARDWSEFAHESLSFGQRLKSGQKPVPEGPINDALAAVDQGEKADPKLTNWPKLREDLKALLQKDPAPNKQEQKDQKDQKDQKPNDDKSSDKKDQQDKKPSDGKDGKDGQQDKSSDPSKNQAGQKDPKDSKAGKDDSSDKNQEGAEPKSQKPNPADAKSAFGDMKNQTPPPSRPDSAAQPAPDPGEMQKVGGTKENQGEARPADPALALPLQKLDQVRRKDAPGELFQFLNGDQKPEAAPKNLKNW